MRAKLHERWLSTGRPYSKKKKGKKAMRELFVGTPV